MRGIPLDEVCADLLLVFTPDKLHGMGPLALQETVLLLMDPFVNRLRSTLKIRVAPCQRVMVPVLVLAILSMQRSPVKAATSSLARVVMSSHILS